MKKLIIIILILLPLFSYSQDPKRFEEEINKFINSTETYDVVFTGSSSVRLWESLSQNFPEISLINTGFGGSEMQDLLFYIDDLVIDYRPQKIFIYEGDNDINSGKSLDQIMNATTGVLNEVFSKIENAEVYIISPKPSPSRFHLKDTYEALNDRLKELSAQRDQVEFIDVWTPMLNKEGQPFPHIFIEDQLHMNAEGYAIWKEVIAPYLSN